MGMAMHIHYVEDNLLDIQCIENLVRNSEAVKITSSQSLINDTKTVARQSADYILLDINRPDSKSLADDVRQVRKYSGAPILFITGDIADDYRSQAAKVGADGVIDKNSLSLELLQQVFSNAKARQNAKPSSRPNSTELSEPELKSVRAIHQIKKHELQPFYGVLGDMIWQLLCEIAIANLSGQPTISLHLAKNLNLDETLTLRYLQILLRDGLIEMDAPETPQDVKAVQLTALGLAKVRRVIDLSQRASTRYSS